MIRNTFLGLSAIVASACASQAQQAPVLDPVAPQPVYMSYMLLPQENESMKLFFGESALQPDGTIHFSSIWRIAPKQDACENEVADFTVENLLASDVVLIGPPDAYKSAEDIVTRVSSTLYLNAKQHEMDVPDDLASCQARFLASYYALRDDQPAASQ